MFSASNPSNSSVSDRKFAASCTRRAFCCSTAGRNATPDPEPPAARSFDLLRAAAPGIRRTNYPRCPCADPKRVSQLSAQTAPARSSTDKRDSCSPPSRHKRVDRKPRQTPVAEGEPGCQAADVMVAYPSQNASGWSPASAQPATTAPIRSAPVRAEWYEMMRTPSEMRSTCDPTGRSRRELSRGK